MLSTIQCSFSAGEITPSLLGRIDVAKWHEGARTMRNFFVNFRGGATSRAGTLYVGMCKQGAPNVGGTATSNPPRDITFQFSNTQGYALEFGDTYMRVKSNGAYVVEPTVTITGITQATTAVIHAPSHGYSVGDWVYAASIGGMTNLNGLVWIVISKPDADHITLSDLFGTTVNSSSWPAYTSGGTLARIYTVTTPYAAIDLPWLKFTQSADTMSLCCVNQTTGTEYPTYDLVRNSATNWTLTQTTFASSIAAPTGLTVTPTSSTTANMYYSYVVTAVDATTGCESVASAAGSCQNNDISVYAGTNTLNWTSVANAGSYNVYRATPSYNTPVPVTSAYAYAGTSYGPAFTDTNIATDATKVPPTHQNPFARGQITAVTPTAQGSGYTQGTIGYSVTTATGSGFAGIPVVESGRFVGFIIQNNGQLYANTDTITITDSGEGTLATASLTIGKQTGTYPGTVAYYQQRRAYACSLNNPDTYNMSQIGNYTDMDASIPTTDTDAITGNPWAQQVNGIQFMTMMPGGLVVFTGLGIWQLTGGNAVALTPSDQTASPQAYNGCAATLPPIRINYDILHVQPKGYVVRDLAYNFFVNIYTGTDQTFLSSQLFQGFSLTQWAYAEEPYRIIWCVRNDGTLLSFTYLKDQQVYGWARHDTNGQFVGVCTVVEPPVDTAYLIVKRLIQRDGVPTWVYYSERMDNRVWSSPENCWCVDSGRAYAPLQPAATLTASTASIGPVIFTASSAVFQNTLAGDIVRMGGGIATVTTVTSSTVLHATLTSPILNTVPNDPLSTPVPATQGNWSINTPVTTVVGLNHLEGMSVSIVADGSVSPSQTVTNGSITLPFTASWITVGLPFSCQLQTMPLDPPGQQMPVQGDRKNIYRVVVRVQDSRGLAVGTNQADPNPNGWPVAWEEVGIGGNMKEIKERGPLNYPGNIIPLYTGDWVLNVPANWAVDGDVAIEQNYPMPATVLAVISHFALGDQKG